MPSRSGSTTRCASLEPEEFLAALAPAHRAARHGDDPGQRLRPGPGRHARTRRGDRRRARLRLPSAVEPLHGRRRAVSSSRIRASARRRRRRGGERPARLAPFLRGTVVHGDRARAASSASRPPTSRSTIRRAPGARHLPRPRSHVPERGVGPAHPALVSVGVRPTFHDDGRVLVEVYLLDWDGDLYDARLDARAAVAAARGAAIRRRRGARDADACGRGGGRAGCSDWLEPERARSATRRGIRSGKLRSDYGKNVEEYVPLAKDTKSAIVDEYATHEGDTGSPEVQIALLTERIKSLTEHLRSLSEGQSLAPRAAEARRAAPTAACVSRPQRRGPLPHRDQQPGAAPLIDRRLRCDPALPSRLWVSHISTPNHGHPPLA